MHCPRRWRNRSQLLSNLASHRIVPSGHTLPNGGVVEGASVKRGYHLRIE
jgi:hypothetical protein